MPRSVGQRFWSLESPNAEIRVGLIVVIGLVGMAIEIAKQPWTGWFLVPLAVVAIYLIGRIALGRIPAFEKRSDGFHGLLRNERAWVLAGAAIFGLIYEAVKTPWFGWLLLGLLALSGVVAILLRQTD